MFQYVNVIKEGVKENTTSVTSTPLISTDYQSSVWYSA